jgi:hypothetical protein
MLQALEWEESASASGEGGGAAGAAAARQQLSAATPGAKAAPGKPAENGGGGAAGGPPPPPGIGPGGAPSAYENPSKHLVYRPAALQLLSILATTMEVLPRDGVLLLYLSACGGRGGELAKGGAFASTSNLVAAEGPPGDGAGGGGGGDGSQPDNASDASGLSVGALTVSNSGTEAGLNLGPAKVLVRPPRPRALPGRAPPPAARSAMPPRPDCLLARPRPPTERPAHPPTTPEPDQPTTLPPGPCGHLPVPRGPGAPHAPHHVPHRRRRQRAHLRAAAGARTNSRGRRARPPALTRRNRTRAGQSRPGKPPCLPRRPLTTCPPNPASSNPEP